MLYQHHIIYVAGSYTYIVSFVWGVRVQKCNFFEQITRVENYYFAIVTTY